MPFVAIQVLMVGIVIAFPQLVTGNIEKEKKLNADEIMLEFQPSGIDRGYGAPSNPADWADEKKDGEEAKAGDGEAKPKDPLEAAAEEAKPKEEDPAAALMEEVAKGKKKGK